MLSVAEKKRLCFLFSLTLEKQTAREERDEKENEKIICVGAITNLIFFFVPSLTPRSCNEDHSCGNWEVQQSAPLVCVLSAWLVPSAESRAKK